MNEHHYALTFRHRHYEDMTINIIVHFSYTPSITEIEEEGDRVLRTWTTASEWVRISLRKESDD